MCFKIIDLFIGPVELLQMFTGDEFTYLIIAVVHLSYHWLLVIVLTYVGLLAGVLNFGFFSCFRKCLICLAIKNNHKRMA